MLTRRIIPCLDVDNGRVVKGVKFVDIVSEFEKSRQLHKKDTPWVNFNAALSNAGYSQGRTNERHEILMSWVLRSHPSTVLQ